MNGCLKASPCLPCQILVLRLRDKVLICTLLKCACWQSSFCDRYIWTLCLMSLNSLSDSWNLSLWDHEACLHISFPREWIDTTPCFWLAYHSRVFPPLSALDINRLIAGPLAKEDACAHNQYDYHSQCFNPPVKFFNLDFSVSDLSTHKDFWILNTVPIALQHASFCVSIWTTQTSL